ncbi:MAG: hypothetical protein JKY51_10715 [Opitutaceae bacterium]|nr:hypothetical protein [Opitutaceae bacterium]
MKPLALALKYMDVVFSDKDMGALRPLLSDRFTFKGTLNEYNNPESYIQAMKKDPPIGFQYKMLKSFETRSAACLVYEFSKTGVNTSMAQMFEVSNGQIDRIVLIFDSAEFSK